MLEGIIPYNHKLAPLFIRNTLYSLIPEGTEHIYVIGIGSNLINGDSLGPFVGTLLHDLYPKHLSILGNLQSPLDATNLVPKVSQFNLPENSFVIAIDSVLGSEGIVNSIVIRDGSMQPGKGLGHNLPSIGDCSIMGVVLENNPGLETSLFYTSLHLIYKMATNIAKGISLAIRQFFHYPSNHPLLLMS
ncbi:sporulation protein [Bacillus sp. SA1-12]|nr:sporulation protein [Bacillus sp. SA1-12]